MYRKNAFSRGVFVSFIFPRGYDPEKIYNGCGPDYLQKIPLLKKFLGSSSFFNKSCEVHDYQYSLDDKTEPSETHRELADEYFLSNMLTEIEEQTSNWFEKFLRKAHAKIFYWAVRKFGKTSYKKREG